MDYKQYGVIGDKETDLESITFDGTQDAYLQNKDDSVTYVKLPENKEKPKLGMSRLLRHSFPGKTDKEILELQGIKWHAKRLTEAQRKVVKKALVKGSIASATALSILSMTGCGNTDTPVVEPTAIETTAEATEETEDKLSLENVSYATLIEALNTGKLNGVELNETQRQFLLEAYNFVNDNAQQEEWEKVTLTDEELEAVNERLVDLGYPRMVGNTAQFGFEENQVIPAMIRLNRNLSNEDIARITGGNLLDISNIMDTKSNEFINSQMQRYLYGGFRNENGLDATHYDVTKLLGFGDHEIEAYNELTALINEYSSFKKDGNREDAQAKMVEIEGRLMDILTSPGYDGYFKEYLGETVFVAAIVESQVENYRTDMTVTVIDSRTGRETEITREAQLFNEYETALVISGLDTFDEEAFMKKYKIDTNRYEMVITPIEGSIVNAVCGEQRERLEEFNEWIKFIPEDELASYREDTLVLKTVIAIMDEGLKDKYPINVQYFNSFSSLYKDLENTNDITNGNRPSMPTIPVLPGTAASSIAAMNVPEGGNPLGLDPATNAALQAQAAANAGAVTASQAAQIEATYNAALQEIYNAAYNYYFGQNVRPTSVTFDPAWLQNSDPFIVNAVNTAHAQADAEKYTHDGGYSGGGTSSVNNGLGPQTDQTAPQAGQAPAATQEVVNNSNQSNIDQQMANVEASTNGNGTGNGTITVPGDTTTTETQAITAQDVNNQPGGPQTNPDAHSTNQAPTQEETYDDYQAALDALNSGYKSK